MLDKRLHAYRDDLADRSLKSKIDVARYVDAIPAMVTASVTPLRRQPADNGAVDKELLRGEKLKVFEEKDGWAWVQSQRDDYVGYCPIGSYQTAQTPRLTHRVNTLRSLLFQDADLKSPVQGHLSLNAEVTVISATEKFSQLSCGNWIFTKHLIDIDKHNLSFLEAAKLYLDAPYLWGGNNDLGADCSGLVQMAAYAVGYRIPRDADMQENFFEENVSFDNTFESLQINDLIFWPGHVAIYAGDGQALHANATEMKTCFHTLDFLIPHIKKIEGYDVRSVKRPNFNGGG